MWVTTKPNDDGECQPDSSKRMEIAGSQNCVYDNMSPETTPQLFLQPDIDGNFENPIEFDCPGSPDWIWVVNANSCMPMESNSLQDIYWVTWDSDILQCRPGFEWSECFLSCIPIDMATADPDVLRCEIGWFWNKDTMVCEAIPDLPTDFDPEDTEVFVDLAEYQFFAPDVCERVEGVGRVDPNGGEPILVAEGDVFEVLMQNCCDAGTVPFDF